MSPQGSASIWIFIELTLAFLATVYKRMPIGFYLVATNKPLCLTCIQMTLHDKQTHISALPYKQLLLPEKFALCTFRLPCMKKNALLGNRLCFTFPKIWNWNMLTLSSMHALTFCIMKYLIYYRGIKLFWEILQCKEKSRLFFHSAHLYIFSSVMILHHQFYSNKRTTLNLNLFSGKSTDTASCNDQSCWVCLFKESRVNWWKKSFFWHMLAVHMNGGVMQKYKAALIFVSFMCREDISHPSRAES